jgi:hypothetical protein
MLAMQIPPRFLACFFACVASTATVGAQHHSPSGSAMGFDQDKTAHHFRLTTGGGAIEVVARDPADRALLAQVRTHLQEIAAEFAAGQFGKPFMTHGEAPAGVRVMEQRKHQIAYTFEEIPAGGRVVITTSDRRAKNAVHDFLRYQIREHQTGDPTTVDSKPR